MNGTVAGKKKKRIFLCHLGKMDDLEGVEVVVVGVGKGLSVKQTV